MSEKLYKVYIHTNKINGKKYIGITCRDVNLRWQYGKGYINNEHFYRAICKYGWDNFSHEIIADGLSKDDACDMEIALIAQFKTQDCNFGYNITAGGDSCLHTDESRGKMSKHNKNKRKVIIDGREFDSIVECSKFLNVRYDDLIKCLSTNTLIQYNNSDKDIHYIDGKNKRNYNSRRVVCDGVSFGSVRDCAAYYNIHENTMRDWLKGKYITPIDFVIKNLHYADENPNYQPITNCHKYHVFYDGVYYNTLKDFCTSQCINYHLVTKYGYNIILKKYLENGLKMIKPFISKPIKITNQKEKII